VIEFSLRNATQNDLPAILGLVKDLAEFERAPDEVTITLKQLEEDGFGDRPLFWVIVAESKGSMVGMSFYYIRYSTWKGKCLYLEDIIVKEAYRENGIGKALFEKTIEKAKEIQAKLIVWQVLEWNEPAINFYKAYGADLDGQWLTGRLYEDQIQNFVPA